MEALSAPPVEWAVAAAARTGEACSGDRALVQPWAGGLLVAVIDGLGHGEEAGVAAAAAAAVLGEHAGEPLEALCRRCHQALRRTRGAALALAAFDRGALAWLAVGSVQGSLAIAATPGAWHGLVQAAGLVGLKLPPLRVRRWPLAPGDTLVIATDGARAALDAPPSPAEPPQRTADQLLARTFTGEDDALVLVARCRGVIP